MASIRNHNGKWQASIKRNGIAVEKSFINKRDADTWAHITEAEIERGDTPHPFKNQRTRNAGDLFTHYLDEVRPSHRSKTTSINLGALQKSIGHVLLSDINAQVFAR